MSLHGPRPALKLALGRLLLDAVTRPSGWRGTAALWRRRLLPTLGGQRMSLREAFARAATGRLWRSDCRGPLAVALTQAGTPVLDGADPHFGPAVRALGRAIQLDDIDALDVVTVPALHPHTAAVIAVVNRWLAAAGAGVEIRLSTALRGDEVRDVDLRRARRPAVSRWPGAWVALSHTASPLRQLGRARMPTVLEAYALFEWLLERSELLAERRARLRAAAAGRALVEAAS